MHRFNYMKSNSDAVEWRSIPLESAPFRSGTKNIWKSKHWGYVSLLVLFLSCCYPIVELWFSVFIAINDLRFFSLKYWLCLEKGIPIVSIWSHSSCVPHNNALHCCGENVALDLAQTRLAVGRRSTFSFSFVRLLIKIQFFALSNDFWAIGFCLKFHSIYFALRGMFAQKRIVFGHWPNIHFLSALLVKRKKKADIETTFW